MPGQPELDSDKLTPLVRHLVTTAQAEDELMEKLAHAVTAGNQQAAFAIAEELTRPLRRSSTSNFPAGPRPQQKDKTTNES